MNILGVNVQVAGIPQAQALFQGPSGESQENLGQQRHQQSREDVWAYHEGSSIMAQNVVPMVPTSQVGQTNTSPSTLPEGVLAPPNKGNIN